MKCAAKGLDCRPTLNTTRAAFACNHCRTSSGRCSFATGKFLRSILVTWVAGQFWQIRFLRVDRSFMNRLQTSGSSMKETGKEFSRKGDGKIKIC